MLLSLLCVGLLCVLLARRVSKELSQRNTFMPWIEGLECRLTPATYTWTGANGFAWEDEKNWSGGQVPGEMDTARFTDVIGDLNCEVTTPVTVGNIVMLNDYTHDLKIQDGQETIGSLTLKSGGMIDGGEIVQDGGGNSLSVEGGSLDWTGGSINGLIGGQLSNLFVSRGASFWVMFTNGQAYLGDDIYNYGTVWFSTAPNDLKLVRNAGIDNEVDVSVLNISMMNGGNITTETGSTGVINNSGQIWKLNNSTVQLGLPIKNVASTATLTVSGGTLTITGLCQVPTLPNYALWGQTSVYQSDGVTEIFGGATLNVAEYWQDGGTLRTLYGGNAALNGGNVYITGGDLVVAYSDNGMQNTGQLNIDHNLYLTGNTDVVEGVDLAQGLGQGICDSISVAGSVCIAAQFGYANDTTFSLEIWDGPPPAANPPRYTVLVAVGMISGDCSSYLYGSGWGANQSYTNGIDNLCTYIWVSPYVIG
jgi:hypothetical protein